MRVVKARFSGFCFGVKRAVQIVREKAREGEVFTLGPLIHNPPMIEKLKGEGIFPLSDTGNLRGKRVVVPSHGLSPDLLEKIKKEAEEVIDATCPFVERVRQTALSLEKEGYPVLIIGDREHPEVKGILGSLKRAVGVVSSGKDIPDSLPSRIGVVSQTTVRKENVEEIVSLLRKRVKEVKYIPTICLATEKRQSALREILPEVEVVVVVGGRNSANTRRLYEISLQSGKPAYWVERKEDIDREWFKGVKVVGITAGASTPDWLLEEVINYLESLNHG